MLVSQKGGGLHWVWVRSVIPAVFMCKGTAMRLDEVVLTRATRQRSYRQQVGALRYCSCLVWFTHFVFNRWPDTPGGSVFISVHV